jgi:hypothetical protein
MVWVVFVGEGEGINLLTSVKRGRRLVLDAQISQAIGKFGKREEPMNLKGAVKFISTDVRRGWVLCNIVLAAGPIAVTILSGSPDIFPATLTYCYALLVVGAYLFYRYFKSRDITGQSDTMFWTSIVVAVAILLLLMGYNSNPSIVEKVNSHLATTIIVSLIIIVGAFYLAYKLNFPIISEEEAKLEVLRKQFDKDQSEAEAARLTAQQAGSVIKAELKEEHENL